MTSSEPSFVSGVILAAGRSERFAADRPKLLLELGGVTLLRRVALAATASRLREVVVVGGGAARRMRRELEDLDVRWITNPNPAAGLSSSVRLGLGAVAAAARAAMFVPADQPFLSRRLIDRLIGAYEATGGPIVVPRAGDRPGAPVLWDRSLFPELAALAGDTGGRALLARHADDVEAVEIDDPRELFDVDTMADYEKARRESRRRAEPAG